MVRANAIIEAANAVIAGYPNPHVEIARLTQLLADDAYITHFSARGQEVRIRGRATDAAKLDVRAGRFELYWELILERQHG